MLPKYIFFAILIIVMLCFSAAASLEDSWNQISLYVVLPIAFMISFLQYMKVRINTYFTTLLLLYLWVMFTTLFSYNVDVSLLQLKQILGCVILCYIVATQVKNEKLIPWLYLVYIILYLGALDYAYNNIISMMSEVGGHERVNDDKLNANTLAYYTFYVTFVIFILGEIIENKKLREFIKIVFFCTVPLSFWIAIITASRQVLILQVPLIAMLLYFRYIKFGNNKTRLFIIALVVICIVCFAGYVIDQYEGSYLAERSQIAVQDDSRFILVKECIEIGLNNLFVGVGPGCVRFFTTEGGIAHNTFLELWAGTGIVGVIIYAVLICKCLKTQIKRYKKTRDKLFMYFLVFGLFFTLDQLFFSFYNQIWLMGFFMLVASHSEVYYNSKYQNIIKAH